MLWDWRRLEADMTMATEEQHTAGHNLMGKMGRNWLVILALSMLALLAVLEKGSPLLVGGAWILAVVALLLRDRSPRVDIPQMAPPVVVEAEDTTPENFSSFKAGLGTLDSPIFVLDKSAAILFENEAAEKIFGQLSTGTHISARLRSPSILDMIRETIMTGEPNQIEHSERSPSEQVFIVRIAKARLPKSQGQSYYILSFRDISELRRLDRMRSDFVANASHELRTPLASLRGFIETMLGPAKNDPAAQTRFLGIMLDQATRMSRLVDDLMSLSRLELRAHIAPDQKVDLVPLLGHVRDALLPLASELNVDINLHVPDSAVEVQGDRDELVQVFQNLVENACKYGQEGKVVDIWLKAAASNKPVEVSVIDKGPGIPKEHLPRLTERFYRVSVTDSRSKKGTGLGLAIVKHILTRHRARLIVKSELGEGTEFTVRF
jgi:two-component system phosphate regulon sensor histidine kinase PhoR